MTRGLPTGARLLAIGDLHVGHPENRELVERLAPATPDDWLVVCGDVGDSPADLDRTLAPLADRFAKVVGVPGNHELLCQRDDPPELRGERRYDRLVEICRSHGVVTPEDPYPVWEGPGGPAAVVPLFLLYDYSFGRVVAPTKAAALERAHAAGVVCVDEFLLDPSPHADREAWCHARVADAERRLADLPPGLPTVLVSHWPLHEGPTRLLRHPEFAQWCGTALTADWHVRYGATAVVYGHLHIPLTSWYDGVRFEEVSLGYPRERAAWRRPRQVPRRILPAPEPE
jgi:3',5'-cyclic AMP phosphodiesterase CpdA